MYQFNGNLRCEKGSQLPWGRLGRSEEIGRGVAFLCDPASEYITGSTLTIALTTPWSFVSGIIWGFSLVVPGLSSSSILLFMGLYEQIMAAVGNLDLSVIIPLILGIAAVALLFARLIDLLFEKHHGIASHAIVGLVIASTVMIVPRSYASAWQALLCLAVAAAGFLVALSMNKWGEKIKPKG